MIGQATDRRQIHILHVVRRGLAGGGMENGIINVANGLPADRFRISICALDSQETFSERIRRPGTAYHLLPKRGRGIDWALVWRLARLLRQANVDVAHSHNWGTFLYAVLAAKWTGVPVIHGEHGKNAGELDEINRPKAWAKRWLGPRVERVVTVSRAIAAEWAGYGVPADKIQWIPNGVDVERFRPAASGPAQRRRLGLPETGYLIGSVGRFDPIKNYAALIGAFAQLTRALPGSRLALVGDGPCEPRLRQRAATLGVADRICWLGRRRDPEALLPLFDVFVLPSHSEGMSNVVLEAMACGVPVVCADLPSHREVFEPDREGVVVAPCTTDTLAGALAALAIDPQRRLALGRAARAKALARFDLRRMVADYERLYAEVGAARAPASSPLTRAVPAPPTTAAPR